MSHPAINKIMNRLNLAVQQTVEQTMRDMVKDAKTLLSVPVAKSHGHTFRSQPGEPPRRETGRLQRSISAATGEISKDKVVARLIFSAPYAAFPEHGTSRMAKRPFKSVILSHWRPELKKRLARAVRSART